METTKLNQYLPERWEKAVGYFRSRSPVVFVSSNYRFWEKFGFAQQSLARLLVQEGIRVEWLEGVSWRPYSPVVEPEHPLLNVRNLPAVPLRGSWLGDQLTLQWQTHLLKSFKDSTHPHPFLWVWGGLDERVSKKLDIDVYSVFDEPYSFRPGGPLCEKAKLLLLQNHFIQSYFAKTYPEKAQVAFPPFSTEASDFKATAPFDLPPRFPKKVLGYLGGSSLEGFDFYRLGDLLKSRPDWGFILIGPTDGPPMQFIEKYRELPNFFYRDRMDRKDLAPIWKRLTATLLLYRPGRVNEGAFPIKVLESFYFGKPCIATDVPKTSSLKSWVPLANTTEELMALADRAEEGKIEWKAAFEYFQREMNPRLYLCKVAEWMQESGDFR